MYKIKHGLSKFQYDTKKYYFQKLIFKGLSDYLKKNEKVNISRIENLHKNTNIAKNVEVYRQYCFAIFKSKKFQKIYKKFGLYLIKNYFNKNSLLQKTPTVRIQLPGEKATPYHSDRWYGHGKSVKTVWLPITKIDKGNTLYVAKNENDSLKLMKEIERKKPPYYKIFKLARNICRPLIGKTGDIFIFSSNMLHGTEVADMSKTRISFDFRIAENVNDLGIKPRSNYYSTKELKNINFKDDVDKTGLFYTNLCKGESAKSQVLICKNYCEENNIKILGGDSEILPLSYLPILRNYLTDKTLKINCVVAFGLEIFNSDKKLAKEILLISKKNKRDIFLCSQNINFNKKSNINEIINKIK